MPDIDNDTMVDFSDEALEQDSDSTEETQTEESQDEPDNEQLGILDENNDEDDDPGDLPDDLKAQIEKHPEIAGRVQEFLSRKEKGVQKVVRQHQEAIAKVQEDAGEFLSYVEGLNDPSKWQDTIEALKNRVAAAHGQQIEQDSSGSKYGLDYAGDDKVVDVATQKALEKLGVKPNELQEIVFERRITKEAASKTPLVAKEYGSWVTEDLVAEAMRSYPTLPVNEAFAAKHIKKIAKALTSTKTPPRGAAILNSAGQSDRKDPGDFDWRSPNMPTLADYIK